MFRFFTSIAMFGLLLMPHLRAQDNGYFFNACVRATISRAPFYPNIEFYGALRMRDLQFPVANPEYKAWWQINMVPEDPALAAQLAGVLGRSSVGHVTASGTQAGHMILQFTSQMGNWQLDIIPLDTTLRQYIASVANEPNFNADAGIQTLAFVVGSDSVSVTAVQPTSAEGQPFFWQRPRQ
jgi:hypothetical protein